MIPGFVHRFKSSPSTQNPLGTHGLQAATPGLYRGGQGYFPRHFSSFEDFLAYAERKHANLSVRMKSSGETTHRALEAPEVMEFGVLDFVLKEWWRHDRNAPELLFQKVQAKMVSAAREPLLHSTLLEVLKQIGSKFGLMSTSGADINTERRSSGNFRIKPLATVNMPKIQQFNFVANPVESTSSSVSIAKEILEERMLPTCISVPMTAHLYPVGEVVLYYSDSLNQYLQTVVKAHLSYGDYELCCKKRAPASKIKPLNHLTGTNTDGASSSACASSLHTDTRNPYEELAPRKIEMPPMNSINIVGARSSHDDGRRVDSQAEAGARGASLVPAVESSYGSMEYSQALREHSRQPVAGNGMRSVEYSHPPAVGYSRGCMERSQQPIEYSRRSAEFLGPGVQNSVQSVEYSHPPQGECSIRSVEQSQAPMEHSMRSVEQSEPAAVEQSRRSVEQSEPPIVHSRRSVEHPLPTAVEHSRHSVEQSPPPVVERSRHSVDFSEEAVGEHSRRDAEQSHAPVEHSVRSLVQTQIAVFEQSIRSVELSQAAFEQSTRSVEQSRPAVSAKNPRRVSISSSVGVDVSEGEIPRGGSVKVGECPLPATIMVLPPTQNTKPPASVTDSEEPQSDGPRPREPRTSLGPPRSQSDDDVGDSVQKRGDLVFRKVGTAWMLQTDFEGREDSASEAGEAGATDIRRSVSEAIEKSPPVEKGSKDAPEEVDWDSAPPSPVRRPRAGYMSRNAELLREAEDGW